MCVVILSAFAAQLWFMLRSLACYCTVLGHSACACMFTILLCVLCRPLLMLHLSAFAAAHLRTAAAAAQRHDAAQNVALLVASERQAGEAAAAPGGWPGPLVRAFEVRPHSGPTQTPDYWRTVRTLPGGWQMPHSWRDNLILGVGNPHSTGMCIAGYGTESYVAHMVQGNDTVAAEPERLTATALARYAAFALSLQLPESVFQVRPLSTEQCVC